MDNRLEFLNKLLKLFDDYDVYIKAGGYDGCELVLDDKDLIEDRIDSKTIELTIKQIESVGVSF